jgi:hypothetical protein
MERWKMKFSMRKWCVLGCLAIGMITVTSADITVVSNGNPNADIITGSNHNTQAYTAALTLQRCILASYGANLPVLDSGGSHSVKINIGTNFGSSLNGMDPSGFVISFSGSNIGIAGPTEWGTAIGVYEFLERYVGVRWLMPGEAGEHIPVNMGSSLVIPQVEVRQEPAFFSRMLSGFPNSTQTTWAYRNRMYNGIVFHHNLINLFKPSVYADWGTNPKADFWPRNASGVRYVPASDNDFDWQSRFTATGIIQEAVNKIKTYFSTYPSATSYSLGINDSTKFDVTEWQAQQSPIYNFLGLPDYSNIYYDWANQVIDGVIAPTDSSLMGYWRMEGANWHGEDGEVRDASGRKHHGKALGSNGRANITSEGKIEQAATFDDTNRQWLSIPGHSDFTLRQYGTISAWVYPTKGDATCDIILGKNGSGWNDMHYVLYWRNQKFYGSLADGSSSLAMTGPPQTSVLPANTWYHVVFTWDIVAGYAKIYLNGTLADTKNTTITPADITAGLGIGRNYTYDEYYFPGKIDEVAVWNKALSDAEIGNLYNAGSGKLLINDKKFGCLAYCNVIEAPDFNVHDRLLPFICYDRMKWAKQTLETEGHALNAAWADRAFVGWYDYIYGAFYCLPRVYFHKMAEYYQYAKNNGVKAMYAEAYPNWGEGPKLYIALKLQWDPALNVDTLLNEWYQLAVGGNPDTAGTAAYYLKQYYALWENFWTVRVIGSSWWTDVGQFLNYGDYGYLEMITREDIEQSRYYLDQTAMLAETAPQQARAEMLRKTFTFYEAAAMIYIINKEMEADLSWGGENDISELVQFTDNLNTAINGLDSAPALKRGLTNDPFFQWLSVTASSRMIDSIKNDAVFRQDIEAFVANGNSRSLREEASSLLQTADAVALNANPSFENGAAPWSLFPGGGTTVIDATNAHTGTHSVKCTGTYNGGCPYYDLPFTTSGYYTACAYIKVPQNQDPRRITMTIRLLDQNHASLTSMSTVLYPEITNSWKPIMVCGYIPAYVSGVEVKYLRLALVASLLQPNEIVWIDDVKIFKPVFDGAAGIVENGSFEAETGGNPDYWTVNGNGTITRTIDARSGDYSMKFDNTTSATLEQTFDVLTVPLKYSICGYVRTPQGQTNGTVKMRLKLLDQSDVELGEIASQNITPVNNGYWEPVELICDVPKQSQGSDIKKAKLVLAIEGFSTPARQIWLDDITMNQTVDNMAGKAVPLDINFSFENESISPWQIDDCVNGSLSKTAMAFAGSYSMALTANSAFADGGPYQNINSFKSGKHVLSAQVKYVPSSLNSANVVLYCSALNAANGVIATYASAPFSLIANNWTNLTYIQEIPTKINNVEVKGIRIQVKGHNLSQNDKLYFDDICLRRVMDSAVVNSNLSFEEGSSPWDFSWHENGGSITQVTEEKHTGDHGVLFTGGEQGGNKAKGGPFQKINGLSGGVYTASAWIKVPQDYQGAAYIDFVMTALDINQVEIIGGRYYSPQKWYNLQPGKWMYVEFTQIIPAIVNGTEVHGINVNIIVRNAGVGEKIYIDDVQLLKKIE